MNDRNAVNDYLRRNLGCTLEEIEVLHSRQAKQESGRLLKMSEAAREIDVCEKTIKNLIQAGMLCGLRVGPGMRSIRITRESLQAYQQLMIKNFEESEGVVWNGMEDFEDT